MSSEQTPGSGGQSEELIRSWIQQREVNPELAEISKALMKRFGGAEGVADEVRKTYEDAPEGSNTKALLLKAVLGLVEETSPKGGPGDYLKNMKPEQIAELAGAFQRMMNGSQGKEPPANG